MNSENSFNHLETNYLLNLEEIVNWQIKSSVVFENNNVHQRIHADLPALQRGAVWKAAKVEAFWDSLIRGFPLGSFLLSPYDAQFGRADYKFGGNFENIGAMARFHLLDGQQRATALATGFLNVWDTSEHPDGPVLWVDLASRHDATTDRLFLFRLLTRSHPWGYSALDSQTRLSHAQIRSALQCFREIAGDDALRGATLPLRSAWPWDAICPVPVPLLIKAAAHADWPAELERLLTALPMWHGNALLAGGEKLKDQWQEALAGKYADNLRWLIEALRDEILTRTIPAVILRERRLPPTLQKQDMPPAAQAVDAVETLFVRINTAGEPLSAEDLIYSSLKAVWPDAPKALEKLQGKQRIVAPEHMVAFLYRLHLAFSAEKLSDKAPAIPEVAAFRSAMRNAEKLAAFQAFVEARIDLGTINSVSSLVRLASPDDAADWKLPPTLAAAIFAGRKGLEFLFIAAAWIIQLENAGISVADLTEKQQRRSLGFLVAMAEFAQLPEQCVARLWPQLIELKGEPLTDFFNRKRFAKLLPVHKDQLVMLPIVPPQLLVGMVRCRVTSGQKGYPGPGQEEYWKSESLWRHYSSRLAPEGFSQIESSLRDWMYGQHLDDTPAGSIDEATRKDRRRHAWSTFLDSLWGKRAMVDYAQRKWLMRWYPDFDPTLPGQMEDLNRPWDYDHIHPRGLTCNEMPGVIRDWHQSIGNLRAWPLELNRADQKLTPEVKLNIMADSEEQHFSMPATLHIREASFINDEWDSWQQCVPDENYRYLASPVTNYRVEAMALVTAITDRFCSIYAHWYQQLRVGDLQAK